MQKQLPRALSYSRLCSFNNSWRSAVIEKRGLVRQTLYAEATYRIGFAPRLPILCLKLTPDIVSPPRQETCPPRLPYCTSTYSNPGSSREYFAPLVRRCTASPCVPQSRQTNLTLRQSIPKRASIAIPRTFRYTNRSEVCLESAFDQILSLRQG